MKRSFERLSFVEKMAVMPRLDISDEIKRSMDKISSMGTKITVFDGLSVHNELKQSMERISTMAGVAFNDEMKRSIDTVSSAEAKIAALSGLGVHDELKRSFENVSSVQNKIAALSAIRVDDGLMRSLGKTALLTRDLDDALSSIRIPRNYDMPPPLETPNLEPISNPVWETNRQLAELTGTVTQLFDVARQQADLSQAISNTSDLALNNAIQSGEEARAATQLACKSVWLTFGAIIVTIIIASVTFYENRRADAAAENRRQEEIRVLHDISGQLKALNGQTSTQPATKP